MWTHYLKIADPAPRPLPREEDWTPTGRWGEVRGPRRVLALATSLASLVAGDVIATANPAAALAPLVVGGLLVMLMMPRRRPPSEKCAQLAAAFARAETAWHSVAEEWRTKAAAVDFASERRAILALKAQLDALSVERAAWLQALAKPVPEAEQRLTHLAQFRIEDAGLYNIGAARMAVLRSWGVETAAETDEEKVGSIPGFGRNLKDGSSIGAKGSSSGFSSSRPPDKAAHG